MQAKPLNAPLQEEVGESEGPVRDHPLDEEASVVGRRFSSHIKETSVEEEVKRSSVVSQPELPLEMAAVVRDYCAGLF